MDVLSVSREQEAFVSRLRGAVKRFEEKGLVTRIGFVDELTYRLAKQFFSENYFHDYSAILLRPDSSRRFLTVGSTTYDESEICYVHAKPDKFHSPSHRDYMGALMSLQIDRKLFGDIAVTENSDAFFAVWDKGDIVEHLISNFTECGSSRLRLEVVSGERFKSLEIQYDRKELVVSSLRADCVFSSIANVSRSQAKRFVENGDFKVFSCSVTDSDFRISNGDVFSIRGFGKYRFIGIIGSTRSERLRIELLKFGNYIERKTTHDSTS